MSLNKWNFEEFINNIQAPSEDQRKILKDFLESEANLFITQDAIIGMSENDIDNIPKLVGGTKSAFRIARKRLETTGQGFYYNKTIIRVCYFYYYLNNYLNFIFYTVIILVKYRFAIIVLY
jgi:hypothetical protein